MCFRFICNICTEYFQKHLRIRNYTVYIATQSFCTFTFVLFKTLKGDGVEIDE